MSGAVWGALGAIIVANILLSGDNAVVIAIAARSLPPAPAEAGDLLRQRCGDRDADRPHDCCRADAPVPYLKIVGALRSSGSASSSCSTARKQGEFKEPGTLAAAIRTILVADLVMSIDNVIAVAAAASRAPGEYRLTLLVIGLATLIPLIIIGSTLLMKFMGRFPIIVVLGAALLGFLAGEMFVTDPAIADWFRRHVARPTRLRHRRRLLVVDRRQMAASRRRRCRVGDDAQFAELNDRLPTPVPMMTLEFHCATDTGRARNNNEDSAVVDEATSLVVLADGMGGYNAGEVASGMCTAFIKTELGRWLAEASESATDTDVRRAMDICVDNANRAIFNAANSNPQYAGMGRRWSSASSVTTGCCSATSAIRAAIGNAAGAWCRSRMTIRCCRSRSTPA